MQLPIIILMITFIIIFIIFIFYLILSSRQEKKLKTIDDSGRVKAEEYEKKEHSELEKNTKEKSNTSSSTSVKDKYVKEDVYKLMEFDRILDDMIVQKNGSRFTMAIQCKGINYDLMSDVEQLSVEEGFITFLNTLKYPIQLYVQAQNIDLKTAIDKFKTNVNPLKEEYDTVNEKYVKIVSAFDANENEVEKITKHKDSISNVYEYAADIISYVEKMSLNKNLLQRKFYILVSYNTSDIAAVDKFSKDEIVSMCSTELMTRCRAIISALASCSVTGKILNSNELADLLYSAYNRDDKGILSVKEAIESGFFRLYSTSEDAFTKRQDALDEYIKNEAKIRALKAMKDVIENGVIETPASEMIEQEEEISRRATNLVKNSNYDPSFESAVNKKILNDFRETKKELQEIDKVQKEEIKEEYKKDVEEMKDIKIQKPEGIELIEKSKKYEDEEKYGITHDTSNEGDNVQDQIKETPKISTQEIEMSESSETTFKPAYQKILGEESSNDILVSENNQRNNDSSDSSDSDLYSNEEDETII